MTTNRSPYGVTIIQPSVTTEREIHYLASCQHPAVSVRFVAASITTVERIAADLSTKPCNRCMARLPIAPANRSSWRVIGR